MPSPKGITAVVAIVLLLMMTVGAAGMAYVFMSGLQQKTQESASGGIESLTESTSSCISVDSVYGNKVYLKNCGNGVITGNSLLVYMDGAPINATMSPATITKGEVGAVNLSGIWSLSYDAHMLKIGNGLAQITQRVVAEPRKDDAAGIWRFEDGNGNKANDDSGNNNVGTLLPTGSEPIWTSGKYGSALQFDGVNDYVDAGNGASFSVTQLSIGLWIKTPATINCGGACYRNLISKQGVDRDYNFYTYSSDGIKVSSLHFSSARFGSSFYSLSQPFEPNTWHYLTLTVDSTGLQKYYYDGNFLNSYQGTAGNANNNYPLWVGKADNLWNGVIDEVRIYNKALTPDETVNLRAA